MHLPRRRALMILSAVTAMAIAACSGGAASPTVSIPALPSVAIPTVSIPPLPSVAIPTVSIPPLPSGLPSELPSGLPSLSIPPLGSFAIASFHQAPDLEGVLPAQVRGVTLEKSSFTGEFFLSGGSSGEDFKAVLAQFSKQPSDLAIAGARDPSSGLEFDLLAFQLAGVDGNQLIAALLAAGQASGSVQPTISTGNISGKQVTIFTDSDGSKSYAYVRGDVAFVVESTADDADALVADILAALP